MPALTLNIDEMNQQIAAEADKLGVDIGQPPEKKEAKKEKEDEAKQEDEKEEVVYRQVLKVGGKEIVLEGTSPAEVLGKVSAALEAATPPEKKEEVKVRPALSQDEMFAIGAKLQQGKVEAIDEYVRKSGMVEKVLEEQGINVADLKKTLAKNQDADLSTSWQSATEEFMGAHPEWVPSKLNEKLMGYKIAELNLGRKPSLQTLEKVFDACKGDGLLQTEAIEGKTEEKTEERKELVKKKATGSSIFGSGQTGASRSRSADSTGKFEAEVQKLQNRLEKGEIDARDFMSGYNGLVADLAP